MMSFSRINAELRKMYEGEGGQDGKCCDQV